MLCTNFMIRTDYRAFQQAPDILNRIGMNIPTHILPAAVINNSVLTVVVCNTFVSWPFIGNNKFRFWMNMAFYKGMKRAAIRAHDLAHSYISAALNNTDHSSFIGKIRTFPTTSAFKFSADKGFVNLNSAFQFLGIHFRHRRSNTMAEIPSGFIRNTNCTFHLIGGDAFLRFHSQINCNEPFFKRQVSVMKDRAGQYGELITA